MFVTNQQNGRVNLSGDIPSDYEAGARENTPKNFKNEALRGNLNRTPLSDLFFSATNIDALQIGMRNMVLDKTCGKHNIGRQSDKELMTIMKGIFLTNSKNIPVALVEQVRELNAQVLAFAVPRLINEINMHEKYLKDISQMPNPLCYGEVTSVKGTKYLELNKL
jgi:hypothetical protein